MRISHLNPLRLSLELAWLRQRKRHEKIRRAIAREFDPDFYRATYPRSRLSGIAPIKHFIMIGSAAGHDPSPLFSTRRYCETYGDIDRRKTVPFHHYLEHGRNEGRVAFPSEATALLSATALVPRVPAPPADLAAFDGHARRVIDGAAPDAIDVIVPVYKGYDHTAACLHAVLSATVATPFELVVVEDHSPDLAIGTLLDDLSGRGLLRLLRNGANEGFVRSVNRGMALHPERDVVLLNADTTVFDGWLDRIVAAAARDPSVATVTPLSNNATICSYPVTAIDNPGALEVTAATLDGMAARVNAGAPLVEVPTGVGFCLLVRRAALDALGPFDAETFGIGYGEENDFCMRALRAGWKNGLLTDTFVEHYGSVSFGASQSPRSAQAQARLAERHPDYAGRVRRHIAADPALPARIRLDAARLARAFAARPEGGIAILFVSHKWGGGIETYLDRQRQALRAAGRDDLVDRSLVMRCHRQGGVVFEPFGAQRVPFLPNLATLHLERHGPLLGEVLRLLSPALVHVNTFAGLRLPVIERLVDAIADARAPVWHVWHDHQPLSPTLTLLDKEMRLVMPGDPDEANTAMATADPVEWVDPGAWRTVFRRHLAGVERVVAPSAAAAGYAERLAPAGRVVVEPHPEPDLQGLAPLSPPAPRRPGEAIRLGVIGAIGSHKGVHLLEAMIDDVVRRGLPIRLDIVGHTSSKAIRTGGPVVVHGRYEKESEAIERLRALTPDLVLIPSIWPETFVFTLSIAFALHLPVATFDLGAQGERTRAYGRGVVLPRGLLADPCGTNEALLAIDTAALWSRPIRHAVATGTALATRIPAPDGEPEERPAPLAPGLVA